MVSDVPLPLRAYRALSGALTPLAGTIARQRLKRGKEDGARLDERRGIARVTRPPGPLVWLHGASVGEVLAGAALVERLREMNVGILGDVGYGDVGGDHRPAFPGRRDPPVRAV